jgi:hypothetical protein
VLTESLTEFSTGLAAELVAKALVVGDSEVNEPLAKNVPATTIASAANAVAAGNFLSTLRTRADGASFSIIENHSGFFGDVFGVIGDSFQ